MKRVARSRGPWRARDATACYSAQPYWSLSAAPELLALAADWLDPRIAELIGAWAPPKGDLAKSLIAALLQISFIDRLVNQRRGRT
jgi:hypothetical protein